MPMKASGTLIQAGLCALLAACSVSVAAAAELPTPALQVPQTSSLSAPAGPNATAAPTHTPSSSPTPELHPLSIDYLRAREFPASPLVIEQVLENGPNYSRYIASYESDGLKQYGLLTIPFGERPSNGWPVVVFNHGYIPPDEYQTTERYVAYVDGFARNGYLVFRPDYRGHANSEGQARGAYGWPDYVIDVLNAVAALKAFPEVDASRLGMWGHSMGGYITLRAMLADPDIKAGVIWAGVVAAYADMVDIGGRPRFGSRGLLETFGPPEGNPELWASISANTYLAELPGPLQLHHGSADQTVPAGFSAQLAVQVRQAGGTAELYEYAGDDHNLSRFFSSAMARSIDFFDQHVKGDSP